MLKTRTTLPPGGWTYTQKAESGAELHKFRSMSSFQDAATEILKFRQGNKLPRATIQEVSEDLDNAQCDRLGHDPKHCIVKKKPIVFQPARLFKAAATHVLALAGDAAQKVGQLSNGAKTILSWTAQGLKPAPPGVAQGRAHICIDCPHNRPGFKPVEEAAEFIRQAVEWKNNQKLEVQGEEKLHTCDLCFCHLPTKIHVPIEILLKDTPSAMLADIGEKKPDCWLLTEKPA
jgi:hypothetical protein